VVGEGKLRQSLEQRILEQGKQGYSRQEANYNARMSCIGCGATQRRVFTCDEMMAGPKPFIDNRQNY
jgi:hypothetical protein